MTRNVFEKTFKLLVVGACLLGGVMGGTASAISTPKDLTWATDYDNDGKGDLILYDGALAKFFVRKSSTHSIATVTVGRAGNVPALGDFNGDGRADLATFNRSTGYWTVKISGGATRTFKLGGKGDLPVPGRYGTEACFRPAAYNVRSGVWKIGNCNGTLDSTTVFGAGGDDLPVPADYDCDGKTDLAVYDRFNSRWSVKKSSDSSTVSFAFGQTGDLPVPADWTGVGCARPAVYRTTTNKYYIGTSVANGTPINVATGPITFGLFGDRPVIANPDSSNPANFVVYRPSESTFYVRNGSTAVVKLSGYSNAVIPTPVSPLAILNYYARGDYNGDGRADFGTATVDESANRTTFTTHFSNDETAAGATTVSLGAKGDAIVNGDFAGDGRSEPGVVTVIDANTLQWTLYNAAGNTTFNFGQNGDTPLTGDVDCDGKTDKMVVRKKDGTYLYWYFKLATGTTVNSYLFGLEGDTPYVADIDGDNCDELIVRRTRTSHTWYYRDLQYGTVKQLAWGLSSDTPLSPADMNGDGRADFMVARLESGQLPVYVRYSRPGYNDREYPRFTWNKLNFASENDIVAAGKFDGPGRAELSVYRTTDTPGYYWNKKRSSTVFIAQGNGGDFVIRPDGSVEQSEQSSGCIPTPGTPDAFGGDGSIWKPEAHGGPAFCVGKPLILLPSSYSGRIESIELLGSDGESLSMVYQRASYAGQPTYGFCSMFGSQLEDFAPLTVKTVLSNGTTICRVVDDPEQRYD